MSMAVRRRRLFRRVPGKKGEWYVVSRFAPFFGCSGSRSVPRARALADSAGDKAQGPEGKIVSVTGDKLVMKGKDGKEHTYTLAPDAKISCEGKVCKIEDLKPGMRISLTTHKEDLKVVTKVNVTKVEPLRSDRKEQEAKDEANLATIVVTLPDGAPVDI